MARPINVHASDGRGQVCIMGEDLSQAGAGSESEAAFQRGLPKVSLDQNRPRAAGECLGDSKIDGCRGLPLVRQRGRDEKRPNVVINVEVAQPGAEDPECFTSRGRTQLEPPHRERSTEGYGAKDAQPIDLLQLGGYHGFVDQSAQLGTPSRIPTADR